ncbi:MAG: replication initiation protein [Rhodocyclaceae bacterium]|nr:replication initiation protein [Rhodocyclaceae bacterium]
MSTDVAVLPEQTELAVGERFVSMSNAVARAAQGLGLVEKRAVMLGLAKTDSVPISHLQRANTHGWKVRITAQEYMDTFGVDNSLAYKQLMEAGDKFREKYVRRTEYNRRGKLIEHYHAWLSGATYHHGEGWVELRFSHEVAPFLLGLREKFLSYQLKLVGNLRSVYAWRLFEILQSWKTHGVWRVSVADFCRIMEVAPSFQKNFGMLNRRVIEPSVRELCDKNGMDIEVQFVRSGRKVTDLEFRFSESQQQRLF